MKTLRTIAIRFILSWVDWAISLLTDWRASLSGTALGAVQKQDTQSDMHAKIQLLVNLRWTVQTIVPAVLLLLWAQGLRLTAPSATIFSNTGQYLMSLWPNWILSVAGFTLNFFYQRFLRKGKNLRPIAHAQIWMDTVLFALVIFSTGGSTSPFKFLYTIPILAASLLLSMRASLAVAALASLLLGGQTWLQFTGILEVKRVFMPYRDVVNNLDYLAATVTLNAILYFIIAFASGVLTATIRRHERALSRRADEANMLYEISHILQSDRHLDDVLNHIMEILVTRLHIDRGLMYLTNEAADGLDLKVDYFHPDFADRPRDDLKVHFPMKREAGLTAICAIDKQPFNVTDPLNHPLINRELAAKIGLNPFAVAPMMARGQVIGVIGIDRKFRGGIITMDEAQILGVAASQAGLTIHNARLQEKFAGD